MRSEVEIQQALKLVEAAIEQAMKAGDIDNARVGSYARSVLQWARGDDNHFAKFIAAAKQIDRAGRQ